MRLWRQRTKDGVQNQVLIFETRFELVDGMDDWNVQVLDLFEQALIKLFAAWLGKEDSWLEPEGVKVSSSYEAVAALTSARWLAEDIPDSLVHRPPILLDAVLEV